MFCKNCGNQVNDNTKFCPKCGTKIMPEYMNQDTPPQPQADFSNQMQYASPTPTKNNTPLIILLICLVLLILGVGAFFFFSGRMNKPVLPPNNSVVQSHPNNSVVGNTPSMPEETYDYESPAVYEDYDAYDNYQEAPAATSANVTLILDVDKNKLMAKYSIDVSISNGVDEQPLATLQNGQSYQQDLVLQNGSYTLIVKKHDKNLFLPDEDFIDTDVIYVDGVDQVISYRVNPNKLNLQLTRQ